MNWAPSISTGCTTACSTTGVLISGSKQGSAGAPPSMGPARPNTARRAHGAGPSSSTPDPKFPSKSEPQPNLSQSHGLLIVAYPNSIAFRRFGTAEDPPRQLAPPIGDCSLRNSARRHHLLGRGIRRLGPVICLTHDHRAVLPTREGVVRVQSWCTVALAGV